MDRFISFIKNIINKNFDLPSDLFTKENQYLMVATFFGSGYFKKAPGTFTSLVTLIIGLLISAISTKLFAIVVLIMIVVGFFVCNKLYADTDQDPSYIVIDEVVGQFLSMLLVSNSVWLSIISFVIFRILDIKKPYIIGMVEKSYKGGVAIMMDDIIAGFITLIIMFILVLFLK
jgi:phosphatidylglycerophosphatase A